MASVLKQLTSRKSMMPPVLKGQTLIEVIRHLPEQGVGRFVHQVQQLHSPSPLVVRKCYRVCSVDVTKDVLGKARIKLQEFVMTPSGFKPSSAKSEHLGIVNNGSWRVLYNPSFDWLLAKKFRPSLTEVPSHADKAGVEGALSRYTPEMCESVLALPEDQPLIEHMQSTIDKRLKRILPAKPFQTQ